jgi:amidase
VPSAEIELFFGQLSVAGPMARTVKDLALLLSVMAGPDPRMPFSIEEDPDILSLSLEHDMHGVRVGWLGDYGGYLPMENGIIDLCRRGLSKLEALGCKIDEVDLGFPPERIWDTWVTLRHWLIAGNLGAVYKDPAKRAKLKAEAVWEIENGLKLSAQDIYEASVTRSEIYRAVLKLFATYEFIALPSAQVFPFDASTFWPRTINGVAMDTYHRWMEVVILASLLGFPAVAVPVGFNSDGLPMGMQIIAKRNGDFAALQLALVYEQETNWVREQPPALLNRD